VYEECRDSANGLLKLSVAVPGLSNLESTVFRCYVTDYLAKEKGLKLITKIPGIPGLPIYEDTKGALSKVSYEEFKLLIDKFKKKLPLKEVKEGEVIHITYSEGATE
jgi:hypothetical protein